MATALSFQCTAHGSSWSARASAPRVRVQGHARTGTVLPLIGLLCTLHTVTYSLSLLYGAREHFNTAQSVPPLCNKSKPVDREHLQRASRHSPRHPVAWTLLRAQRETASQRKTKGRPSNGKESKGSQQRVKARIWSQDRGINNASVALSLSLSLSS